MEKNSSKSFSDASNCPDIEEEIMKQISTHKSFDMIILIMISFGNGLSLANPPKNYREIFTTTFVCAFDRKTDSGSLNCKILM